MVHFLHLSTNLDKEQVGPNGYVEEWNMSLLNVQIKLYLPAMQWWSWLKWKWGKN